MQAFISIHFYYAFHYTAILTLFSKKERKVGLQENEALSALTVDSTSCCKRPRNNEKVSRVGDFVPKCANITNLFQNKKLACWNFERDFWKIQFVKISFLPHSSPRRLPIRLGSKKTHLQRKKQSEQCYVLTRENFFRKLNLNIWYMSEMKMSEPKNGFSFFSEIFSW